MSLQWSVWKRQRDQEPSGLIKIIFISEGLLFLFGMGMGMHEPYPGHECPLMGEIIYFTDSLRFNFSVFNDDIT